MTIAERDGAILRHSRIEDLPAVDALTIEGYAPIQASYVAMLGEETYVAVRNRTELTWEERKCAQNRDLFDEYPELVRVLEQVEYWQDLAPRNPGSTPK